jgi:hypothetical protein
MHLHQQRERAPQQAGVELGCLGPHHPALAQAPDAPLHGRGRQMHGLRDLALRRGVVTLQDVEDGEVEGVELQRIGGRHMGAKIA